MTLTNALHRFISNATCGILHWAVRVAIAGFVIGGIGLPLAEAWAATYVPGGTINSSVTWGVAGSPYIVQGNLTIGSSGELIIQPRADQPSNKHSAKLTPDLSVQKLTCVHRAHIESLGGE
jgi:hypothetical protein